MITEDKSSDLINQAITNLGNDSPNLSAQLWECMKEAALIEIQKQRKENGLKTE